MSKGLGKIERKILQYFGECKKYDCEYYPCHFEKPVREAETRGLCYYVFDLISCVHDDWPRNKDITDAMYKSVLRATRSLEKKGYLHNQKYIERLTTERGGIRWFMHHIINVDYKAVLQ